MISAAGTNYADVPHLSTYVQSSNEVPIARLIEQWAVSRTKSWIEGGEGRKKSDDWPTARVELAAFRSPNVKLGRQMFENYNSVPNDNCWTHDPWTESFSRSLPLRPSPESVYVVPTAHRSEILLGSS